MLEALGTVGFLLGLIKLGDVFNRAIAPLPQWGLFWAFPLFVLAIGSWGFTIGVLTG